MISDGMADVLRTLGLGGDKDLAAGCVRALGVDGVAVSLLLDDGPLVEPLWCYPESSARFEELQYTFGEGPGPEAVRTGVVVLEPDLERVRPERWPALLPAALDTPVRGVFCFPLGIGAMRLGVLTVVRHDTHGLSRQQISDALALTAALTAAFLNEQGTRAAAGRTAVSPPSEAHRAVVHQATGMISVQLGVELAEALVRQRADPERGRGGRGGQETPAEIFVEVADSLIDDFDVIDLLQRLSSRCVELLDVDAAGIMLADEHGELQIMAASDEHTRLLELLAVQHDQGPCVECYGTGRATPNIDLTDDAAAATWPRFTAQARATGYVTTHALPLRLRDRVVGALNLFQNAPHRLGEGELALAQALADVATIAILQQRTLEQSHVETSRLQAALTSRVLIEQVKGVLAERWGTSVDDAFEAFRAYARSHRLRLADFAAEIIGGGFDTALIPAPTPSA
ncbi:GAF and ANTAR domain-containing protein [Streptomyces liangshanensis]